MSILITGGSGTLGQELVRQLQAQDPNRRIVIYSRDEGKQAAMAREFPEGGPVGLRYMLGDVCDTERLKMALKGVTDVTHVIHAAAMKMIDKCEMDSIEATRINVMGTLSVAKACIQSGVARAIYISTDKSPDACSLYGLTKRMAESIWVHSNCYGSCQFDCVRYGNVLGSNKSVMLTWKNQARLGEAITVTEADATRFFWRIREAAAFTLKTLARDSRGVIYIPKMKSYRIMDMATVFSAKNIKMTGFRCPEKMHECLWTDWENGWVRDLGDCYALYPMIHPWIVKMAMPGQQVDKPLRSCDCLSDVKDLL